jgi:hypothetical protein
LRLQLVRQKNYPSGGALTPKVVMVPERILVLHWLEHLELGQELETETGLQEHKRL